MINKNQLYKIINRLELSGFKTKNSKSHFLSQIDHESRGLRTLVESLNYSTSGLIKTFSRNRISLEDINRYGRLEKNGKVIRAADQVSLANILYGGVFGLKNLGNTEEGDGWKYRGRGPLMCTGRAMYKKFSDYSGIDFVKKPELMIELEHGLDFAIFYWFTFGIDHYHNLDFLAKSKHAKKELVVGQIITKKINGGYIGIDKRAELFYKYLEIC